MSRAISEFKGRAVVIGCTHHHSLCDAKHHLGEENFYTIDCNSFQKPDFDFDITSELPEAFKSRFQLTYLECIDFSAYNDDPYFNRRQGVQGFQNVWDMTTEHGFIVIKGCPRQKEFRRQIYVRQLHYIELDAEGECVLIPKNQHLSFNEVIEQIENLEPLLKKTIEGCRNNRDSEPNTKLDFCDLDFDSLFSRRPQSLHDSINTRSDSIDPRNDLAIEEGTHLKILAFKRVYLALYQGQSSFFKHKSPLLLNPLLSLAEIEAYVKKHPNSRSSKAWSLVNEHVDTSCSNQALFKAIHQYSFKRSSSFFGLFRRSLNFPGDNYEHFDEKIKAASAASRTGKIRVNLSAVK